MDIYAKNELRPLHNCRTMSFPQGVKREHEDHCSAASEAFFLHSRPETPPSLTTCDSPPREYDALDRDWQRTVSYQPVSYDNSTANWAEDPTERSVRVVELSAVETLIENLKELQALAASFAHVLDLRERGAPGGKDETACAKVKGAVEYLSDGLETAIGNATGLYELVTAPENVTLDVENGYPLESEAVLLEYIRTWVTGGIDFQLQLIREFGPGLLPAEDLAKSGKLVDDCCQAVWHWPHMSIADKMEFLIAKNTSPRRGLLRVHARSVWDPSESCQHERWHGKEHSIEIPITLETDSLHTFDPKCLSIRSEEYFNPVLSSRIRQTFLTNLEPRITALNRQDQEDSEKMESLMVR
jgi:hypothetical protein